MVAAVIGAIGLGAQAALFVGAYLLLAPTRGRSLAVLAAALLAVDGWAIAVLGAMTLGIPWQASTVVAVLGTTLALLSSRLRARLRRRSADLVVLGRAHAGAAAVLAAFMVVQVVAVALAPEMSIDGQLYHGPVLAQLLQHGTVWGWDVPNQYLYYSDLAMVSGLNLTSATGAAVFDNGVQLAHLVILILAISALLKPRFGSSWVRIALASVIVAAPVIWIQPRILYVDVAYGAALVAAVALIVLVRRPSVVDLGILTVATTAVIAVKPAGLLTGLLLLVVAAATHVLRGRVGTGVRPWARRVLHVGVVYAVIGFAAAGFYIRNLVAFGSPVYPVATSIGPIRLPGIVDFSIFASGERGSGLVDPVRWRTYVDNLLVGATQGVTKLDYDPKAGGFGFIPVAVVLIALLVGAVVLVARIRGARSTEPFRPHLSRAAAMVGLSAAVLLVQPSTFDSRYVIGPTVVLLVVVLTLLTVGSTRRAGWIAGTLAIAVAAGQVVWTERTVYPGLDTIRDLRTLDAVYQPTTPGNPWGRGTAVSWLPDDPQECVTIAVQTEGGLAEWGVKETAPFSVLPYSLYGPGLCNSVVPMQIASYEVGPLVGQDPIPSARFLILYDDDLARWANADTGLEDCWTAVDVIPGNDQFVTSTTVFARRC